MESTIIKRICANNGSMNISELENNFYYDMNVSVQDVILNHDMFCLVDFNGEQRVVAKTDVRHCRSQDCHGCRNLHFCKRFLLGECPFVQRRRGCRFSHDLTSVGNRKILNEHGLEELNRAELCTLLLQNDNFLLPPVSVLQVLRLELCMIPV
uniref:Zinc finger CCCH type antiviral protein 1 n=1 Tax=Esox lucius TaxID=8010 RepID=C1BWT0_ESOLU|nr:Zinc finger CCCH type antiviral protein 1 [Esox lucius]